MQQHQVQLSRLQQRVAERGDHFFDVIVVGGGPAGLSAALVLGRACRKVLLIDEGRPRNFASEGLHGYLTRDGIKPLEFISLGVREASAFGVTVEKGRVETACPITLHTQRCGFMISTHDREYRCRKLLLATGVVDLLPKIDGMSRLYGRGVYHCPYCDGWEHRGKRLCAYSAETAASGLALSLKAWSSTITLLADGREVSADLREQIGAAGIGIEDEPVAALVGSSRLIAVRFGSGREFPCDALFISAERVERSTLPGMLGCTYRDEATVCTTRSQSTGVEGLYLAGDADGDVQFVVVAAAEGAKAAVAINRELLEEDLRSWKFRIR